MACHCGSLKPYHGDEHPFFTRVKTEAQALAEVLKVRRKKLWQSVQKDTLESRGSKNLYGSLLTRCVFRLESKVMRAFTRF